MGHELYRMILDGAPAGWTSAMRLVALVIADDARDPGRRGPGDDGWPWSTLPVTGYERGGEWHDGITERTGYRERTISHALNDLAAAGYEMREQAGTDRRGRPVFAYHTHAVRFRVPPLPPRRSPDTATIKPAKVAKSGIEGRRNAYRRSQHSATPSPQVPRSTSSPRTRGAAAIIRTAYPGATDDEIESITEGKTRNGARSVEAVLAHEAERGTLRLPCDPGGPEGHSEACRGGDGRRCRTPWCVCRCHVEPVTVSPNGRRRKGEPQAFGEGAAEFMRHRPPEAAP